MDDQVELHFLTEGPLPVRSYEDRLAESAAVVARLGGLGAGFRPVVERAIYDFYLQEIKDGSVNFATAQDQIDWETEHGSGFGGAKAATAPAEIWPLVRFSRVVVDGGRPWADGRMLVRVEGNAAWDGEHGIVLHFDEDASLVRVTGYGVFL